jgi:hypothetical protein
VPNSEKHASDAMAGKHKMDESQDDEGDELCPLFMQGLPRDFSTNVKLAALASLMDDDSDFEDLLMMHAATVGTVAAATVAMTCVMTSAAIHADDDEDDDSTNAQHSVVSSLTGNADEYQEDHDDDFDNKKRESKSVPMNVAAPAITAKRGGGKVDRRSKVRRKKRHDVPYAKQPAAAMPKKAPKASVGEAELFFKMWNLK